MSPTPESAREGRGSSFVSTVVPLDEVSTSVQLGGYLDATTAAVHARELQALLDGGAVEVRIDLQGLRLCTSDGLDLWDDVQHRLDPVGGHLTLSGATGVVRRVLDVMATSTATHFCPTVLPAAS